MCAYSDQHDRDLGQLSVDWTLEHTDQRSKDFMRELPFDLRFELGGSGCCSSTARRARSTSTCSRTSRPRRFERIAAGADCDVLVFGHTHKPWIHDYGGVLFVNCGSVGKPKDGDPRGGFAVLRAADGERPSHGSSASTTTPSTRRARSPSPACPREYAEKLLVAA